MPSGYFITFEGGEGAGKTTLIDTVQNYLVSSGFSILRTREPGGTPLGEEVRALVLNHHAQNIKISALAELSLFLASRAEHVQDVILPALKENKIVLCDRFSDSSVAYQGYARKLGMEKVENICLFISQGLKPDLTFYLDLDPLLGLERAKRAKKKQEAAFYPTGHDRIESENLLFHQEVRQGFHKIAKNEPKRFHVIDAAKSAEDVAKEAVILVEKLLKGLK